MSGSFNLEEEATATTTTTAESSSEWEAASVATEEANFRRISESSSESSGGDWGGWWVLLFHSVLGDASGPGILCVWITRSYRVGDCFLTSSPGLVGRTTAAIQARPAVIYSGSNVLKNIHKTYMNGWSWHAYLLSNIYQLSSRLLEIIMCSWSVLAARLTTGNSYLNAKSTKALPWPHKSPCTSRHAAAPIFTRNAPLSSNCHCRSCWA